MKTIIAIDPGASGGIAVQHITQGRAPFGEIEADRALTGTYAMPETRGDAINLFKQLAEFPENTIAYIEKISGFIPDGGASQMFEFGKSVERVGCILETLGVRIIEVTPQSWMKSLALGKMEKVAIPRPPKGMTSVALSVWKQQNTEAIKSVKAANARLKTEWKNKLKAEAQRRFPTVKVTLKNCDALLILEVAKMMEGEK
jgi:hypothetical protein